MFLDLAGGVEQYLAQVHESIGGEWCTADEMAALGHQDSEKKHASGKTTRMSMSNEHKTKIREHLKSAGVHNICPACNQEVA